MGYWDATDNYLSSHGGRGPTCPVCGQTMLAADDHGRFTCFCDLFSTLDVRTGIQSRVPKIPQVPENVQLTDEQKKDIPPINRLNHPPTQEEKKILEEMERELGIKSVKKDGDGIIIEFEE